MPRRFKLLGVVAAMAGLLVVNPAGRASATTLGLTAAPASVNGLKAGFIDNFTAAENLSANTYLGQPGGDPAGWWDPSHVAIQNGTLVLSGHEQNGVFVTGGISFWQHAFRYGTAEVRMRVDRGDGIAAIALLWPATNTWPPEVDFYEDAGGNRASTSATLHYGLTNEQIQRGLSGVDFSQWHTLGVQWLPGHLTYYLDGKAWASVASSAVPNIPMTLDLQTQAVPASPWSTGVDATTPPEVDMHVDWVAVYPQPA